VRPDQATHQAHAVLTNFKVNLFGFVILWFEELTFRSKDGQKPDVAVTLRDGDDAVQFGGPLEFVNEVRNLIPVERLLRSAEPRGDAERHQPRASR
jgi:hypothetical protein